MTIQYAPSAAAISWLALSQALDSRALMEKVMFDLFADNMSLSVTQTQSQAANAQRGAEDQAKMQRIQGIMAMVGAGAAVAVVGATTGMEGYNLKKASGLNTETEVTTRQANGASPSNSVSNSNGTVELEAQQSTEQSSIRLDARTTENATSSSNTSKDNESDANKTRQNQFMKHADWWLQNSNSFTTIVNQALSTGVSNLWQIDIIKDQGQAKAAESIAQGLSGVFNSESSMLSSAISSCDSNMQNTNGTISTIIQVSSLRG